MAESWIKVSLVCVLVSMVLQLVAITTPGWLVENDFSGTDVYNFVTSVFNVLLTWLLTVIVACMKVIVVAKRRTWAPAFTSVCMTFLAIANTLQWQIVGQYANHSVSDVEKYDMNVLFPWCVFLAGLGALLVSGVLLMHIMMFVKRQLKPALRGFNNALRLYETTTTTNIAESWIKVSMVCVLVSMVLQLVAITTPGWEVLKSIDPITAQITKVYLGIFYLVSCLDGTCTSESIPSLHFSGTALYDFVTSVFNVLLTLLLTVIVACMNVIVVAKRRTWAPAFTSVCMTFLAIANTLQWQIVGQYANYSVSEEGFHMNFLFPWCVFLAGLGALLVSGVLLMHIVMFVKRQLKPALSGFNNALNTDV